MWHHFHPMNQNCTKLRMSDWKTNPFQRTVFAHSSWMVTMRTCGRWNHTGDLKRPTWSSLSSSLCQKLTRAEMALQLLPTIPRSLPRKALQRSGKLMYLKQLEQYNTGTVKFTDIVLHKCKYSQKNQWPFCLPSIKGSFFLLPSLPSRSTYTRSGKSILSESARRSNVPDTFKSWSLSKRRPKLHTLRPTFKILFRNKLSLKAAPWRPRHAVSWVSFRMNFSLLFSFFHIACFHWSSPSWGNTYLGSASSCLIAAGRDTSFFNWKISTSP